MKKETTPTVDAIGQIHIEGNTIPSQWFKRIQHGGRPDAIAVILLGEVFYWYRPTVIRDEATGEVKEIRRKFDKDKWQCSYQSLADRFGFTKRQATDAAKRLRDAGLITMEFRNFKSDGGIFLSNVLYIEPVPDKIRAITFESDTPSVAAEPILRSSVTPPTPKEGTYTEIPTETPTDKESGAKDAPPADKESPKLPDAPAVVKAKEEIRAILEGQNCGANPALADATIDRREYRKRVGAAFATVFRHDGPSRNDTGAAGKLFDIHFPIARSLQYLEYAANGGGERYRTGTTKDGKGLTAYHVIGDMDDWRKSGYPTFEQELTGAAAWDALPRFKADTT